MRETQEDYYLVLLIFASQLYFYVLSPSSLLGYQYFNLGSKVIFVIRQLGFPSQLELGLAILYKQHIVLLEEIVDILMNENNDHLVFLWSGADSRSTLDADSQWFSCLVLTLSKAQVLTPRSSFIFPLFQFYSGCPALDGG